MRRSDAQKRRDDLVTIIGLKQATIDAKVAQLGAKKRVIDNRRAVLNETVQGAPDADSLVWLARAHEMARTETLRLDKQDKALEADIRTALSESVSLEIAKRKLTEAG